MNNIVTMSWDDYASITGGSAEARARVEAMQEARRDDELRKARDAICALAGAIYGTRAEGESKKEHAARLVKKLPIPIADKCLKLLRRKQEVLRSCKLPVLQKRTLRRVTRTNMDQLPAEEQLILEALERRFTHAK